MECAICSASLKTNRELLTHLAAEHDRNPTQYFAEYPQAKKYCSKCKRALAVSDFLSDKSNNYGFRAQCLPCMKPGGVIRSCPICSRSLKWSAVITHMKNEHGIAPIDGYKNYLGEKLCPNCKSVKSLDSFSRRTDPEQPFSSWCTDCNLERNLNRALADHAFGALDHLIVRLAFSDCCFVCKLTHDESLDAGKGSLQIDHLLPHIKGGVLTVDNAVLLCQTCNLGKGSSSLFDFVAKRGAVQEELSQMQTDLRARHTWAMRELGRVVMRYERFSDHGEA